tara:strand:+ start:1324 stop:1644 length:321 start_codon:yes stop_codon:yes gene_type:complete
MKMVLVFDTDDKDGMRTSMKMMQTILRDYGTPQHETDPRFGKIEFIKMLKDFDAFSRQLLDEDRLPEGQEYNGGDIRLKTLKQFADNVWSEKRDNKYYTPKWIKRR